MKITKTMFVDLPEWGGDINNPETWSLWRTESTCDVCLGEVEVTFDIEPPSDIEVRDVKIANIKNRITKERADCSVKVERMENEIQRLMAIEVDDE